MIKIIKKATDRPSILYSSGEKKGKDKLTIATNESIAFYNVHKAEIDAGTKKMTFNKELYAHKSIKEKLLNIQHDKCCFCEAKISHIAYGDVEHFRPKAAYSRHINDVLQYPGYYWLAYAWENLFLSCQLCNQRFKKNLFPLLDESSRILDCNKNCKQEKSVFLDPVLDNPEDHITFQDEVPKAKNNSIRGHETIKNLALDRIKLNENRRAKLADFLGLLHVMALYPDNPDMKEFHEQAKAYIMDNIFKKMEDSSEYAAMFRALYKYSLDIAICTF